MSSTRPRYERNPQTGHWDVATDNTDPTRINLSHAACDCYVCAARASTSLRNTAAPPDPLRRAIAMQHAREVFEKQQARADSTRRWQQPGTGFSRFEDYRSVGSWGDQ
jgi:hypothetical protein